MLPLSYQFLFVQKIFPSSSSILRQWRRTTSTTNETVTLSWIRRSTSIFLRQSVSFSDVKFSCRRRCRALWANELLNILDIKLRAVRWRWSEPYSLSIWKCAHEMKGKFHKGVSHQCDVCWEVPLFKFTAVFGLKRRHLGVFACCVLAACLLLLFLAGPSSAFWPSRSPQ